MFDSYVLNEENAMFFRMISIFSLFFVLACSSEKTPAKIFEDDFNRAGIGENYANLGGDWKIENLKLVSVRAENKNLVLKSVDLPQNAVIEMTMKSNSKDIDVKFNLWGDGKPHDHGDGYTFILGGWKNRVSVISKLDEHEKKRSEKKNAGLEKESSTRLKSKENLIKSGGS